MHTHIITIMQDCSPALMEDLEESVNACLVWSVASVSKVIQLSWLYSFLFSAGSAFTQVLYWCAMGTSLRWCAHSRHGGALYPQADETSPLHCSRNLSLRIPASGGRTSPRNRWCKCVNNDVRNAAYPHNTNKTDDWLGIIAMSTVQ